MLAKSARFALDDKLQKSLQTFPGSGLAWLCMRVLVKADERALDGGARGRDQLQGRSWRTARPRNRRREQCRSFATPQECGPRFATLVVARPLRSRTAPRNV